VSGIDFSSVDMARSVALLASLSLASGLELTPENWDKETSGKACFIKFLAPW